MVSLTALWLPIVLSAVLVFLASSVVHMVLTHHQSDYKKLPKEEDVLAALRKEEIPPGTYFFPHAKGLKELGSPEVMEKFKRGPVGLMTVKPSGPPTMGKELAQWFVFCLVIGVFVAYLCSRTLDTGTAYMTVFRLASTVAFLGFSAAEPISSIWKGQPWSTTLKHMIDGLVYALLVGGVFGWLWP